VKSVALLLLVAAPLVAQPPPVQRPPVGQQPPVVGRRLDSLRASRDTARGDTTRRPLVEWRQPDSLMRALLDRAGYNQTRYQGDTIRFDNTTRTFFITGKPAAVGRGESVIVGDSILYNDSTQIVVVFGNPLTIRDPARNPADIVSEGRVVYDLAAGRAVASQICTAMDSDERWYMCAEPAALVSDSTGRRTMYAHFSEFTSCDLAATGLLPHYHFSTRDVKFISNNIVIARSVVLFISDVPVFWLPFLVQDIRSGRRSGILTPRFGIAELLRNSPTYRRTIDNLGYYVALSDYMDAQLSVDWRSGARPQEGDPGYVRYNGEWRYRWLSRFVSGQIGVSHLRQQDGATNTAISLGHNQEFSEASRLSANLNYVTSTTIQRQNEFVPYRQLATIASRLNYSNRFGPFNVNAGGSRTQYPGLDQVDQTLPTLSLSSEPIEIAPWLVWTPSLVATNSQRLNVRQSGGLSFLFNPVGIGGVDSTSVESDSRTSTIGFETPLRILGWNFGNSFRVSDVENNFPELREIVDVADTSIRSTRVFEKTFRTDIDWQVRAALPALFSGTWNLTPSVSLVNVDPAAMWVRTERTGGRYVAQTKRVQGGLSVAPTFFALFEPRFGPWSRIRHAVNTNLSWSFAPAADVSNEFLAALGRTRQGYLGSLRQNALSLSFNTNIEAKMRVRRDSTAQPELPADSMPRPLAPSNPEEAGPKLTLLAMNFDALTWDFERAKQSGGMGLTTDRFGFTARSDLLPGLDFSAGFSLFQGSTLSDTAVFKPFLTDVRAAFSLNRDRNPFLLLARLFGRAVPTLAPELSDPTSIQEETADLQAQITREQMTAQQVATGAGRSSYIGLPPSKEWAWALNFSLGRQRPPVGEGIVIELDDTSICTDPSRGLDPFAQQRCIEEIQAARLGDPNADQTTAGAPFRRLPTTATIQSNLSVPITSNWAGAWQTSYDFESRKFASHAINLEREMHDWRATFSILHAPNGNFAFSFFIALKAQPDLKFDYNRQSRPRTP
jgi:hypothetical protein